MIQSPVRLVLRHQALKPCFLSPIKLKPFFLEWFSSLVVSTPLRNINHLGIWSPNYGNMFQTTNHFPVVHHHWKKGAWSPEIHGIASELTSSSRRQKDNKLLRALVHSPPKWGRRDVIGGWWSWLPSGVINHSNWIHDQWRFSWVDRIEVVFSICHV